MMATKSPRKNADTKTSFEDGEVAPPLISSDKGDGQHKDDNGQHSSGPSQKQTMARRKSVVMTTETVKQIRATKSERKMMMDSRHQYLISKLADALALETPVVEDHLLSDERFYMIDEFFAPKGARKLIFFYQEPSTTDATSVKLHSSSQSHKKLFITPGTSEGLNGVCLFFLRIVADKAVTVSNIESEVLFMWMDCSGGGVVDGFQSMMTNVLVPLLKAQKNWGQDPKNQNMTAVNDFFDSLDKFTESLNGAKDNVGGRQIGCDDTTPLAAQLDSIKTPADYRAACSDSELVKNAEELLITWSRQIAQILTESEQIRREADDIGPNAELVYWKGRMAKFNSVLEQIKSPRCKAVLGILNVAQSKALVKWRHLDMSVTDAANEAKDNVKYLYTLDKFFGPLTKCNPSTMLELIPSLINALRMIYSISSHYNTKERMTSLFVKVTNQMITTCKTYVRENVSRIWEHSIEELSRRIADCVKLNEAYQHHFRKTKELLQDTPSERQFDFSENYIFGKFDTFTRRLSKIADMISTINAYAGLEDIRIEGVEVIAVRYKNLVEAAKKKNYDVLDHRKQEFESDYTEFKNQFDALQAQIQKLMDSWFEKNLTTEQSLELLAKFENISACHLEVASKYAKILSLYGRDLEQVRVVYQSDKANPSVPRNLPPIAGRIAWARQLYRRIEAPMKVFKKKPDLLKSDEGRKVIRNYNKLASVLLEYEVLYHRGWYRAIETARSGLNASLLITHPENKELYFVNLDPQILELLQEAKYLQKMHLDIDETVLDLCQQADRIKRIRELPQTKADNNRIINARLGILSQTVTDLRECDLEARPCLLLQGMLTDFERISAAIPSCIAPLLQPYRARVEKALSPGLSSISWSSVNIDSYLESINEVLRNLEHLSTSTRDTLENRIEAVLNAIATTQLCPLTFDEPVTVDAFSQQTEQNCSEAATQLTKMSTNVENAVKELIESVQAPLTDEEFEKINRSDAPHSEPDAYTAFWNLFTQKNTDALIRCTRTSLEALRRRLQNVGFKRRGGDLDPSSESMQPPLLLIEVQLSLPRVVMLPSLEDTQAVVNRVVQAVIGCIEHVTQWEHLARQQVHLQKEMEAQAVDAGEDLKHNPTSFIKPLHKIIADNKDVTKVVMQLNAAVMMHRPEVSELLTSFGSYDELWKTDVQTAVAEFAESKPTMSDYESRLKYYTALEEQISDMTAGHRLGPFFFSTDRLKTALIAECRAWKLAYGRSINESCGRQMDGILEFFENMQKPLSRPVKDLDDIRAHMAALVEIRESEIRIDLTIAPIEEAYAMLGRYELVFNDGNAERVDSLGYGWRLLRQQAIQVQNHLLIIQPEFKGSLLDGVAEFKISVDKFVADYTEKFVF